MFSNMCVDDRRLYNFSVMSCNNFLQIKCMVSVVIVDFCLVITC